MTEEERETVVALSGLAAGLAGGIAGGDLGGAVTGAKAGSNAVENNSLSDIAEALAERKTLEQKAEEHVKAENERYKEQNCAGMSTDACSAQMYAERRETLAYTVAGVTAVAGAVLLGPALLNSCAMNPAVCTELTLTAVELPFGAATAGGTALGVGGFGSLAAKELAATADAAAAARNVETANASALDAKATGGAAEKVDDVVAPSSKPEWLQRLDAGNEFNKVQSKKYPNNEVYIQRPDGNGYYRVDSYNPIKGEIVSRKFTQLSEATAKSYISEAITKYPSGATIAKFPSSGSLGGQKLQGTVILEVPPQN
ncbi:VENN motif pre-toxin domain-containing protein [Pseudomonas rhodesiae]|uniref:VENN motif pre-toxin domain-containing protein n=1 Tax=Pseudomonas rhodesiae TaxID=76760 RepID=UPI001FC9A6FC|nr:VENN motif pre-toxin domain-containing protein [Pseudomonas rhodesiae]